jgi:hypothetical protein
LLRPLVSIVAHSRPALRSTPLRVAISRRAAAMAGQIGTATRGDGDPRNEGRSPDV